MTLIANLPASSWARVDTLAAGGHREAIRARWHRRCSELRTLTLRRRRFHRRAAERAARRALKRTGGVA